MICRPTKNKSKGLIQVISTTYTQPQQPEYQLEVKADEAGASCCVKLTVELPEVCSMSDCQLRISKVSGFQWFEQNRLRFQRVVSCH